MRTRVYSRYTYTLETIIQAGQRGMNVTSVPIRTNRTMRSSRLVASIPSYILKSVLIILRIFVVYRPFRFFFTIGLLIFIFGTALGIRYLWYLFTMGGQGHIQSLILASIMIGIGFQTIVVAFVADMLSVNRRLSEDIQYLLLREALSDNKGRKVLDEGESKS